MKKFTNYLLGLILFFTLAFVLSGCQPGRPADAASGGTGQADQTEERVSVLRQGLSRNFVLSEDGIYCLQEEKTTEYDADGNPYTMSAKFIMYCDKNADHFTKLCSRADCLHHDHHCDAWVKDAIRLGYYNGYLYYIDLDPGRTEAIRENYAMDQEVRRLPPILCRMDKRGRNREEITRLCSDEELERFNGAGEDYYSAGYVTIELSQITEGVKSQSRRAASLGKPTKFLEIPDPKPEEKVMMVSNTTSNGEIILTYLCGLHDETDAEGQPLFKSVYRWNPKDSTVVPMGNIPWGCNGYYGTDGAYYAENGVLYRWDYGQETAEILFDTAFQEGNMLYRFPDFFIVTDLFSDNIDAEIHHVTLMFYDQTYAFLGECEMNLLPEEVILLREEKLVQRPVVFGETEDRILLSKGRIVNAALPAYYIEKSDFGTGNITLHEYHYPEE